ncbi:hypothetical protein CISIN_1g038283mg, partial [Citrus sinensis]
GNQDKEDRISSLPDGILCNILSFLPFKYPVATCILSSRWKCVWTSLPNLCFDQARIMTDDSWNSFEKSVNMALLLSDSVINRFSLSSITRYNLSQLKFWVSSAISRNVRELELKIYNDCRPELDNLNFGGIELPESIYTSKTLENLKLDLRFFIKAAPPGICFPSNLSERLFCNCPMLEDLSVAPDMDCECYETLANFNISSATLRRLTLKNWIPLVPWNEHQVVVRAPNLEYLCIDDESLSSYLLHELHSLTTVSVNIDEHSLLQDIEDFESLDAQADHLLQVLHGITNTKFLSFSTGAIHVRHICILFSP